MNKFIKTIIILYLLMLLQPVLASNSSVNSVNTPRASIPRQQPKQVLNNYKGYSINHDIYYNQQYCSFGCFYSTTLTSGELRARTKARRQARLEAKCKENKAKKSKCEKLMED